MIVPRWLLSVVAVSLTLSCGEVTEVTNNDSRTERQLGVIRFYQDPMLIEVPPAVVRGAEFEVVVRTFGGGCIGQGDTEVSVSGRAAEVRPYDLFVTRLPPNATCTSELRYYSHRATLRFDESGIAVVRVRGRAQPGDRLVVVERTVAVR